MSAEPQVEPPKQPEPGAEVEPPEQPEPDDQAEPNRKEEALEDDEPRELDPQVAARRAAALSVVRQFGDPVLKAAALPVERFDDELRTEAARMAAVMRDALGVGLAATQVGVMHRLLVYRLGEDAPLGILANPRIEWSSRDAEFMEEGCLSLPGVHVEVERPVHVRVRAQDEHGDELSVEASGLEARVIQHEIDHLDGVLILDRTTREERKAAMRAMREAAEARAA